MAIRSVNPFDNKLLETFQPLSNEEISFCIDNAHSTYLNWREESFETRARLMNNCAKLLEENADKYAQIITAEMGKVIKEARAEVFKCATVCRYYADNAERFLAPTPLAPPNGKAYIEHNPIGVILAIMPWNFPFWQVFRFAAPNLMAGNVGLLKHASNVPQCARLIEEIFLEAGFPFGTFQNLHIESAQVEAVLANTKVAAATLTGSEAAGKSVASIAGKYLKKTVLELGGSDPFIVLADAALDETAKAGVASRMINCGQSCIAAKRFIIEASVYDEFKSKFIAHLEHLKFGDPAHNTSDYASLARPDLAVELFEQVQKSIKMGAKVAFGPTELHKPDNALFPPIVLENVTPEMPAFHEELFGPVAVLYKVNDHYDAIRLANDSCFGLGGSVWTTNEAKGKEIASRIESGAVYINKMMASEATVPFGGIKNSGYGRELSQVGILEFVNQKTVWVA